MRRPFLLTCLALAPLAALAGFGMGEEVPEAAGLEITASGFEQVSGLVATVVPNTIAVPDMHQARNQCDYYLPWPFDTTCAIWLYRYDFYVTDVNVGIAMDDIAIVPATDILDVDVMSTLNAGSPSAPIHIGANVALLDLFGTGGFSFSQECDAWMDPVHVDFGAKAGLAVVLDDAGQRVIDASIPVDQVTWSWDLAGSNLNFGGSSCVVADMQDFFDWLDAVVGVNLFDMLLDLIIPVAEGAVNGMIGDFVTTLETQLEDMLAVARLDQSFPVGDAEVQAKLEPEQITIEPAGMRITLAGSVSSPLHPCVVDYGFTESAEHPGDLPPIADPSASPYDVAILMNHDLLDQALFAGWSAGLLCQRIAGDSGIPLTTTMLSLLAPDSLGELLPPNEAVVLETRPTRPPLSFIGQDHTIDVAVDELGLDFYAPVDYRLTRVIGANTDLDIGLDTRFDGATGQLLLDVAFDPATLAIYVNHNEYFPDETSAFEDSLSGLLGNLVGPMLGSLTSGLNIGLPSFEGFGLTTLDTQAVGSSGTFLGALANTGEVTYASSGCGGGCSGAGSRQGSLAILPLMGLLALRRRRGAGTPGC